MTNNFLFEHTDLLGRTQVFCPNCSTKYMIEIEPRRSGVIMSDYVMFDCPKCSLILSIKAKRYEEIKA